MSEQADADTRSGCASAHVEKPKRCSRIASGAVTRNRADACEKRWPELKGLQRHTLPGRCINNSAKQGGSQMLSEIINGCFAFMVLVMLGCLAAEASDIASERAERKRIEREIREKYGRTY